MSTSWVSRFPLIDGTFSLEPGALESAARDFGKIRHRRPLAVVRPAHTEDVVTAVNFCRREGVPLVARGHAHSAGGQMMARGGLVLDMKSMRRVLHITDEFIEVEGGIAWSEVLLAALARGRTPPVVTDWLSVSVGGTISMGGFGFMSFHRGTQMDHLLELEVVTGDGQRQVCSPTVNRSLFDAVRGTHGQFGLITGARIPLEEAPDSVRMVQAAYGTVSDLLTDMKRLSEGVEVDLIHGFAVEKTAKGVMTRMNSTVPMNLSRHVVDHALEAVSGPWVYNLEMSDLVWSGRTRPQLDVDTLGHLPGLIDVWEMSWREFCFRLPPLILEEEHKGGAPHPELTVFAPLDQDGIALMQSEFDRLHPEEDIGLGPVLFFPLKPEVISAPLLRLPEAPLSFFLGLLRRAAPATPQRIRALLDDNEAIYRRVLDVGGVRYLPDTLPEDESFWPTHFGPLWQQICAMKQRTDPAGVLGSTFGRAASASSATRERP